MSDNADGLIFPLGFFFYVINGNLCHKNHSKSPPPLLYSLENIYSHFTIAQSKPND